jgi:hypothetical protein
MELLKDYRKDEAGYVSAYSATVGQFTVTFGDNGFDSTFRATVEGIDNAFRVAVVDDGLGVQCYQVRREDGQPTCALSHATIAYNLYDCARIVVDEVAR